jgi:hypothetical protein
MSDFKARLEDIARQLEVFEAKKSVSNTGAGTRRDGRAFEDLMLKFWSSFADYCESKGANLYFVKSAKQGKKIYVVVEHKGRKLVIPAEDSGQTSVVKYAPWLKRTYTESEILAANADLMPLVAASAPKKGRFAGILYLKMFEKKKTEFDDTYLLIEDDHLVLKGFLEYKTAKSSKGKAADGNAHERLSFQMLQFLEIQPIINAKCRLDVFANGAFVRYENKYHFAFTRQIARLSSAFDFSASYNSAVNDYLERVSELEKWIFA